MLNSKEIESQILKFWEEKKIYEKVKKKNQKGKKFYFLQGPPYTSGKIHIGQAWNSSLKDMIMRYKRMKGFDVWDRGGYDMHGLPTENAVQKKLGLKTKEDIVKYGVDKFVKACIDFSNEYAGYMEEDFWKIGFWMDHKKAYKPIEKSYISGEWAFFKKAWEQKRLYRGMKVMHWDAETETSLAKHELEYKSVKENSVFLKFKKRGKKDEYFIIWTTTPWTIPYNLAIMVNPEVDYVKVKVDGEYWIIAKALAGIFISGLLGKKYEIVEEFKGIELEGQEYEHILQEELKEIYDKLKKEWKNVHTIILSDKYVDTSAGTGLVHCAPGCGPEDQEVGYQYGIGAFNSLNERGELVEMGKYSGWRAKIDDEKFVEEFEKKGALLAKTEIEHEYPHSWRSHKPVIFRTTEQWFLRTENLSEELIEMNKEVRWVPKKSGESYERWIKNLRDNSVTRQRFWGCPVPIWVNEKNPEDYFVIGSVEELEKLSGRKLDDLSLHKPWIDEIIIEKNGKKYKRISDVADVWIDSGTASWNCLYNDPMLIKKYFPADLVLEASEQTRLWFSLLQICSAIMFKKTSYKNVYTTGMIFDFQGMKMSKSLGNIISPYEVIDKYSADVLRYYLCGITAGENINFSWEDVKTKQANLIILSNIANYILDLEKQSIPRGNLGIEEKWILSKYNSTLKKVTELFEEYRLDETVSEIERLFISLSRDYIKLVREKASENDSVLKTVKKIYLGILKMFSTVCPFITEYLWQKMNQKEESVHLCDWPIYSSKEINQELEEKFDALMKVLETGFAERDRIKIGLRWPLASASISCPAEFDEEFKEVITRQLNVKKIELSHSSEFKVKFDTKVTQQLEAEGYSRELARNIQAARKKAGLQKKDEVILKVYANDDIKSMLKKYESFLRERTNSKEIIFESSKIPEKATICEIKSKKIGFLFS